MKSRRHSRGLRTKTATRLAVLTALSGATALSTTAALRAQQPDQYVTLAALDLPSSALASEPAIAARVPLTPAAVAVEPASAPAPASAETLPAETSSAAILPDAPSATLAIRSAHSLPPLASSLPDAPLQALPPSDRERPGAVDLSLDTAIQTAIKGNLNVRLSTQQENFVHGEIYTVGNALVPNLQFKAYSNAQEINLAALGFKASTLASINIPGFNSSSFSSIVKVDVTAAQLSLSQALFNVPAYFLFRAAEKAAEASHEVTAQARGQVVQGVGAMYLEAIADASQARYARALLMQDQVVYDHAREARDAGVGINLDVLRAQTDLLNEQQRLAQAENAVAKDKIQINRLMGQPAGQDLNLTDAVPFAELADQPLEEQLGIAYRNRHDLKGLEAQQTVAEQTQRAIKYERLPTLGVGGFYGIVGVTQGSYHGNFVFQFQASVPLFLEGELRGQREYGSAQVTALRNQIANTRALIESDVRSSRLDLESSKQLVMVARSNVVLAQQALDDATERFTAGVDDNLPVAQAQAALVNAQSRVVQAEFQYNYAKLTLARRLGIAETDYKHYLGQ